MSSINNAHFLEAAGLGEDLLANLGGGLDGRLGDLFGDLMSVLESWPQ